jgi:LL-diaminopimelate aminotransferase
MHKVKMFELSQRLKAFPPYLFAEIDRIKAGLRKKGIAFIDVSIGDPDIPAPVSVVNALYKAAKRKENQKYALDQGKLSLRKSIRRWVKKRFNVTLDEHSEILPLIGSKEGLVHLPLAFVNSGDYIILPSPGYPGYSSAARFAGARIYELGLLEKNGFLPELSKIPLAVRNKARLMYLNYPNNPTTALAPIAFLRDLVAFCAKYGIILAYDNAYSEIYFEQRPRSVLEIKGAKEVALEFHSLSKTFCMTGFRVGWASGRTDFIKALLKVKSNIDSGVFGAVQEAAAVALDKEGAYTRRVRKIIKERRDSFVADLSAAGFRNIHADSTFYVWARIPRGFKTSIEFSKYLLSEKRIVATPGVGFGRHGEGFIRFALTVDKSLLKEVIRKLK